MVSVFIGVDANFTFVFNIKRTVFYLLVSAIQTSDDFVWVGFDYLNYINQ